MKKNGPSITDPEKMNQSVDMDSSLVVAALITFVGGFLDAFTYVGHGGVFANSMTGNIVLLGVYLSQNKWQEVLSHIPPLLAFFIGIYIVHRAQTSNHPRYFSRFATASVLIEIFFLSVIAFLPASFPGNIIVPVIALVASIQYESFAKLESYSYSSVTTTVNLKKVAEAMYDHRTTGSMESKRRMIVFGVISLSFLAGAVAGGISTGYFLNAALLIPVLMLGLILWTTTTKKNN